MDNSTPDRSQLLIQYLDGELSAPKKQELEEQLQTDPALKEELESLVISREAIRQVGLREQVAAIHTSMVKEFQPRIPKKQSRNKIIRYTIAAAASIVLIVGSIMAYNFVTLSATKVYESGYIAYELPEFRDQSEKEKPIEQAYRAKNFAEVKRIHKAGEDNSIKGEFLNGMASFESNEMTKSINSFKEVLELNKQSDTPVLNDETEYYLALAHIKNRDYDLALEILQKIRDDEAHTYHDKVSSKMIRRIKLLKWR